MRIYCKKKDNYNLNISNRVNNLIKKENSENINKRKYYLNFKSNLQNIRSLLKKQLIEITQETICCLWSSNKSNNSYELFQFR